jgi:hypothetical protein
VLHGVDDMVLGQSGQLFGGFDLGHIGSGRSESMLTDKDVSLYDPQAYEPHTFFTTGFPRFWSIRGARGLQAFDQQRHTSY